jgi:APA family basic amino acid/polyamine antiporter
LFSFGGWQNLSNVAGEMRRPERDLWRAILLGVAFVSIVYLLANLAYLRLLPLDRIAGSSQLAADAVAVACGGAAGDLAAALILCSAFGILNGLILSAPRLYFAAAQDGLLPLAVAAVHGRFRTPHIAVLLQGLVAAGLCFWGDVFKLLDYVIFADWLFFSLNALALFALARSGELRQRLRPLGYPVAPLLFLMVSVLMTVGVLVQQWENARIGLGILVLGVLLHAVAGRRKALDPQGPRS